MIRKYIENTEEVWQRLIRMLMDDASDMCRYHRDIYMYIDDDGHARLEWYINPDGQSQIDDDHILLYRCRKHYEVIEDSIDGTAMLADIEDAFDDYAELAYKIMRCKNRCQMDWAYRQEEITDLVPVVWLFVLDADDQFRFEMQRGGESNG